MWHCPKTKRDQHSFFSWHLFNTSLQPAVFSGILYGQSCIWQIAGLGNKSLIWVLLCLYRDSGRCLLVICHGTQIVLLLAGCDKSGSKEQPVSITLPLALTATQPMRSGSLSPLMEALCDNLWQVWVTSGSKLWAGCHPRAVFIALEEKTFVLKLILLRCFCFLRCGAHHCLRCVKDRLSPSNASWPGEVPRNTECVCCMCVW